MGDATIRTIEPTGPTAESGSDEQLARLDQRLLAARSREEVMAEVSHAVRRILHADGATFVLRDGVQCYYAEEDAVSPLWKGRRFPMEACISGWCMRTGQPVVIPDIYKDPRIPADAYRPTFVRSLAMAPAGGERAIAALGAYWAERREARPAELAHLQSIADAAARALADLEPPQAIQARRQSERSDRPSLSALAGFRQGLRALMPQFGREQGEMNALAAYGLAVVCVAVATLLREGIRATGVQGLAIFSLYYPAVLVAVLLGGWRAGGLAAVLGGFAAHYFFLSPSHPFSDLNASIVLNLALYGAASALIILIVDWHQRALLRLKLEDARHLTLAREQSHRMNNAIAVVEAIVKQTLGDQPDRVLTIKRRVRAGLAKYISMEAAGGDRFLLRDLLGAELQAFDVARFTLQGGDETLPPEARGLVSLAVHELATNALKYGALSVPGGRVTVSWRMRGRAATISWSEAGGPPVQEPTRRGFGSVLLKRLVESSGGAIAVKYAPAGVTAEVSIVEKRRAF